MVNTKITPRKEGHRCPMCNLRILNEFEWERHVVECGRQRRQKKFEYTDCDYATNKKSDMGRHRRTRHSDVVSAAADSGTDDWEQLDPGNLSDVVGSTSQNRPADEVCQRKPTRPAPVSAPIAKSIASQDPLTPRAPSPFRHPMTTPRKRASIHLDAPPVPLPCLTREASTQTDHQLVDASTLKNKDCGEKGIQTEGDKRRRLDRVQETYQKDGKTVVEVHEEES
ncbi:uncharacterized protein LOC133203453 [Saccostrea echinata]|uniref:uncharacterized protein LOC133203453 n=1 Tax=Saccostrea echinata TaxID=191078 RepID=UPI002A83F62D|nr:uncharacterized protein LOC133203453 [Saccostrea echinata]